MLRHVTAVLVAGLSLLPWSALSATDVTAPVTSRTVSLDGPMWQLAADPQNEGRQQAWFREPRPEAKATKVPWIIQDIFPGYHGVAWYWRHFDAPQNPHAGGRGLLRFWGVDYLAEVWLNGTCVGQHEGGESPFVLDVTDTIRQGAANLLAVRVINPTHTPIDGIVLGETAHRNKALPYQSGSAWNQGGIIDSVELLLVPAARIDDVFVRPDCTTGKLRVQLQVFHAGAERGSGQIELTAAPATGGKTLDRRILKIDLPAGASTLDTELQVDEPHLWQLNDPFLYRVTARLQIEGATSVDESSVRCGFRDFRFAENYFRLNGRRLFLRSSHTGNCCPIGLELPHDPDLLRRDLLNVKAMGFNMIRFIAGVAKRYQLELCDEIGLMVYEESYAAWLLGDSPKMADRYNESVLGMICRDRNHPCVAIWGLLNETPDGPVFRHAAGLLPTLRSVDDSRLVMLNSGRWDQHTGSLAGIQAWQNEGRVDPCVTRNGTTQAVSGLGITWAPGQVGMHPGAQGEYAVVRWTAPGAGTVELTTEFRSIAERATTDVHVLHNGQAVFEDLINLQDRGPQAETANTLQVNTGDTLDWVVGFGNGFYGADTTAMAARIVSADGKAYDVADDFSNQQNPGGPWSYGQFAPGPKPDATTFVRFAHATTATRVGTLSNPGSVTWEDVLDDQHPYRRVPHTADIIHELRTLGSNGKPLFISEYGVGSAIDLRRVVGSYEQLNKANTDDGQFYRVQLDRFLNDWQRWQMADTFDRPEDYFEACLAKMANQRLQGLNAIRSNPNCVGYSLTGTVDQGMTGEGLTTTYRELKPGTFEAVRDGMASLRWCLFAEPVNVYRNTRVRLEAVLANEDVLLPGEYSVHVQVVGPGATRVFDQHLQIKVPERQAGEEPSWVIPVFAQDVLIDGPPGAYRWLATFERGAAAAGRAAVFYLDDAAQMPAVDAEIVLWGEDPPLQQWLVEHGIRVRPFQADAPAPGEVILMSRTPQAPGGAAEFGALTGHIADGGTAICLCPEVFRRGDDPAGWLPLPRPLKGTLATMRSWVYLKDEWAKRHPIFAGLPAGGLLDLTFYRDLIPDVAWSDQLPPAEVVAGAINTSQAYASGLLVAVHRLGEGRLVLNTLTIRDQLGRHPAAERLLRNMLRYAAQDP